MIDKEDAEREKSTGRGCSLRVPSNINIRQNCWTGPNSTPIWAINIGYYVTQILDAVCQVYSEEDCLLLQTFCDFLKDLGNETRYRKDLEHSIKLEFIQQLFLVQDCSQGIRVL